MTSLDPLFRLLVRTLSGEVPPRIHQPIVINELMDSILPYRLVRRELGVDSAEEYETLLLRLCAGEGDFVQADPAAEAALLTELEWRAADVGRGRVVRQVHWGGGTPTYLDLDQIAGRIAIRDCAQPDLLGLLLRDPQRDQQLAQSLRGRLQLRQQPHGHGLNALGRCRDQGFGCY